MAVPTAAGPRSEMSSQRYPSAARVETSALANWSETGQSRGPLLHWGRVRAAHIVGSASIAPLSPSTTPRRQASVPSHIVSASGTASGMGTSSVRLAEPAGGFLHKRCDNTAWAYPALVLRARSMTRAPDAPGLGRRPYEAFVSGAA